MGSGWPNLDQNQILHILCPIFCSLYHVTSFFVALWLSGEEVSWLNELYFGTSSGNAWASFESLPCAKYFTLSNRQQVWKGKGKPRVLCSLNVGNMKWWGHKEDFPWRIPQDHKCASAGDPASFFVYLYSVAFPSPCPGESNPLSTVMALALSAGRKAEGWITE